MEYISKTKIFGLPLVHIAAGELEAPGARRTKTARGWIALGEKPVGILFAAGGLARGGIAVGGIAVGYAAFGGMALAWHAAAGGMAVARDFALGGMAIAEHANDAAARDYMNSPLMRIGQILLDQSQLFILFAFLPMIVPLIASIRKSRKPTEAP